MQLSHVISDLVLFSVALASWGLGFSMLQKPLAVLWGCFLFPVALAALSGAGRFAELHPMMLKVSEFFQQLASTTGAICLLVGAVLLARLSSVRPIHSQPVTLLSLAVGVATFMAARFGGVQSLLKILPPIAMVVIVVVGLVRLIAGRDRSKRLQGVVLIFGVLLTAAAILCLSAVARPLSIDLYHYLLAASLICFGCAGRLAQTNLRCLASNTVRQ